MLLIAVTALWAGASAAQGPNPRVTEAQCRNCHSDKFAGLAGNPHGVLAEPGRLEQSGTTLLCLDCHGDVSEHIRAGGGRGNVFAFRGEPPVARNQVCLDCHAANHPEFDRSPHAQAGLTCTSCHSQHAPTPAPRSLLRDVGRIAAQFDKLGKSSQLCVSCHQEALTLFNFNQRHRLREGVLECVDCHDPHQPVTRSLLGGFKQQSCTECHSDKGGPFVFEHAASRVEGCTACHSPHGSPNRHMLDQQQVAELCLTCHAAIPQFHLGFNPVAPSVFGLDTQCTTCHSSIHGSNLDSHFLR
jgi:DmsE family decaheme c-type cytochrome